jgi:hypothetical protein
MTIVSRQPEDGSGAALTLEFKSEIAVPSKREPWSWRRITALALGIGGGAYFIATAKVATLLIAGGAVAAIFAGLIAVLIWVQNNVDWS